MSAPKREIIDYVHMVNAIARKWQEPLKKGNPNTRKMLKEARRDIPDTMKAMVKGIAEKEKRVLDSIASAAATGASLYEKQEAQALSAAYLGYLVNCIASGAFQFEDFDKSLAFAAKLSAALVDFGCNSYMVGLAMTITGIIRELLDARGVDITKTPKISEKDGIMKIGGDNGKKGMGIDMASVSDETIDNLPIPSELKRRIKKVAAVIRAGITDPGKINDILNGEKDEESDD